VLDINLRGNGLSLAREEFILGVSASLGEDNIVEISDELFQCRLSYPAADVSDMSAARLTIRQRERDQRQQPDGLGVRSADSEQLQTR
jgi:hypothetical protein